MDSKTKRNITLAIAGICLIAFYPVFTSDFINYDDPEYVLNNHYIRSFSFENIKYIFLGRTTDLYVPLTVFSYMIEYSMFGENAKVFHGVNLILHIINAVLLLNILIRLNLKYIYLLGITLVFFAISPLVTESVCWITERKDVLYCLFYFLAILQFLHYIQTKHLKYLVVCLVFFVLACLSKPMAISLPVLLSLYLIYTNTKEKNLFSQFKAQLPLLPFYGISLVSAVITTYSLSSLGTVTANIKNYNVIEKTGLVISELGYYFTKPFFPFHQQLFHLFPEKQVLFSSENILLFLVIGLVVMGSIAYHFFMKKNKLIGFLFLAWLVFLLPVLQIYSNTHSYVSERYFYVSIIFPVIIVFLLLQSLNIKKTFYQFSLIILIVVFTVFTFKRSAVWKNSKTLFEDELKKDPKNPLVLNNLGYYYNSKSEFMKAEPLLKAAAEIDSDNASYLTNYGWALAATKQTDSAIVYLQKAIDINPNYGEALNNIGICYMQKHEPEKAADYFKKAYAAEPDNKDVLFNLGLYYFQSNQKEKGFPLLKKAYELGNKKALKYLNR